MEAQKRAFKMLIRWRSNYKINKRSSMIIERSLMTLVNRINRWGRKMRS